MNRKLALNTILDIPGKAREFGIKIAVTQFINFKKYDKLGYSQKFINIASKYIINDLNFVIKKYQNGETINSFNPIYNFNKKIPVFVFCYDGYKESSPIVKACTNRMKEIFNNEEIAFTFVTKDNLKEYLELPEYIEKKFENGTITIQQYSDILRFGLLATYGGIWLDSTLFLTQDYKSYIDPWLKYPLYTIKTGDRYDFNDEACRWKWSGFFIGGHLSEDVRIFKFVYDSFCHYWKKHKRIINYVLIDYLIWAGYTCLPDVKLLFDSVPINNKYVWEMLNKLDEKFTQEKWLELCKRNSIYKLSQHIKYNEYDNYGNKTIYKHIIDSFI